MNIYKMKWIFFALMLFSKLSAFSQAKPRSPITIMEEINGTISKDSLNKSIAIKVPNWQKIEKKLAGKYNDTLTAKSILIAKQEYFLAKVNDDWNKYADAWLEHIERFVKVPTQKNRYFLVAGINNPLCDIILKKVNDPALLLRAAKIAEQLVNNPSIYKIGATKKYNDNERANYLDTYANLLYKAGRISDAINLQEKAVELSVDNESNTTFNNNLKKMKEGRATW